MAAKVRRVSRVVVVLFPLLLFNIPNSAVGPADLLGFQTATTDNLDRALRANDLQKARLLFPENWAATEQLFVSYLERGYLSTTDLNARALAARWAEVHFRIVDYDFARAVVQALDTADPARRQSLIDAVRDYFTGLEGVRAATSVASSVATTAEDAVVRQQRRASERQVIAKRLLEVADRFRALSFPRGELWTLRSMLNVSQPGMPSPTARADKIADQLGDELSLVGKRPFTDASLAMAERLGLLRRQATILEELARLLPEVTDREKLERSAKYLERARVLSRSLPSLETVNYWLYALPAPRPATVILPDLWSRYHRLMRPADAQPLVSEALEISRPFGESALLATISAFASRGSELDWDAAATLVEASRAFGQKVELQTLRQLSGSGTRFRPEVAAKALTFALATADAHERAVTLEWYSRSRQSALGSALGNAGRLTPAEVDAIIKNAPAFPPSYDQLLELCLRSDEVGLTADALANAAVLQVETGNFKAAEATFEQAVQHAERSGEFKKAAEVANRASRGRLPLTARLAFTARAIETARKTHAPRELAAALRTRALTSVGASHESLRDLLEALSAARQYTTESADVSEELMCLAALANEREIRGEYQAAIDVLEETVALARKRRQVDRGTSEINAYQRMTRIYADRLGEPALALEAAERARELVVASAAEQAGPSDPRVAGEENFKLAPLYEALGQSTAALEAHGKALTGFRGASNPPLVQIRICLLRRARLLTSLGDYEAALQDLNDILPLMKATERNFGGSAFVQRAEWLATVAHVHLLAGQQEQALSRAREAIAELNRGDSEKWASRNFIDTVVDTLIEAGVPDEVIAFANTYFAPVLALPTSDPVVRKNYHETVARAETRAGRFDQARARLLSAVEIDRNSPTAEYGGLGGSLLALGKLEIAAKQYDMARDYLIAARGAANPYDAEQVWQIERALAVAMFRQGDTAGAERSYDKALTTLESVREQLRPEEFRLRYGERREAVYEEHAALLAARALASGQSADAVRAFHAAERKRTQALKGMLATGWSRTPLESVPEHLRRMFELEARLGAKGAQLMEQAGLPSGKRNATLVENLERERQQLQAEHARLLSALAQSQYRYAASSALSSALAAPVQAALGRSRALVEYLVTDVRSYAFVVSSAGVKVVPLSVGRAELRRQVEQLLAPFRKLRSGEVDLARLEYDLRAAHALYRLLFAPVRPLLGSVTDIVIVPDDVLHFLPFEALVEAAPRAAPPSAVLHGEFARQPFLLRRYGISYLPSAAQLLPGGPSAAPGKPPMRLFAMANPTAGRAAPPPVPPPALDDPLKRQLRSAGFGAYLAPLPGAEAEVERIARTFSGNLSTIIVGANATEGVYKEQAGRHAILHFAAHAVASDGQPLYSTLVLAPDATKQDDGFLQAYEVLRTPLNADLVVLSGCETARGAEDVGQGLVGLVAAFQQAGAKSVLATLWSIDEATAEVMAAFYGAMAGGRSTPAALRQAKLQLLQQRVRMGKTEVSLAHPFFWAPFILVGGR